MRGAALWAASFVLMAGCAGSPSVADWQIAAHDGLERYRSAFLAGHARVADAEFARARAELARTGRPELVARAELTRCALQVASLVFEPCTGFERLRADAMPPERAYADYLAGRVASVDVQLLPPAHRSIAGEGGVGALAAIKDPLARLIATGVLFVTQRADPAALDLAVQTASTQGWRRPLLAWLGVQLKRAEQAGDEQAARSVRQRMAIAGS